MEKRPAVAERDPITIKTFLEVIQRNLKQSLWKYGDFPKKEEIKDFSKFDPAKHIEYLHDVAHIWSGGKDSTLTLWCLREVCGGRVPMDVFYVDTSYEPFPEVLDWMNQLAKDWDLNLKRAASDEVIKSIKNKDKDYNQHRVDVADLPERYQRELLRLGWTKDHFMIADNPACCHLLKTCAFQDFIEQNHYKVIVESVRWDEQRERSLSSYDAEGAGWVCHRRVKPSLFLSYPEARQIQFGNFGVPLCPVYAKGYTSLGCTPCTAITDTPEIERSGRVAQKEKMLARLQALGYHGGESG